MHKMFRNLKSTFIRRTLPVAFSLLAILSHAQQNLGRQTILQFDANHSLFKPDAPTLKEATTISKGLNKPSFFGGVGGVSFDRTAKPATGMNISSLALEYHSANEDGYRCVLTIDGRPVKVFLPDWLLLPIARYAESPYYSCVTLFGKLKDKNLEKIVTEQKEVKTATLRHNQLFTKI